MGLQGEIEDREWPDPEARARGRNQRGEKKSWVLKVSAHLERITLHPPPLNI